MARIGTRRATLGLESLRWQAVVGTLQVSSGALQAATIGDWGVDIVGNGEFTTDTTGWAGVRSTISRVDSGADPGASSGGADVYALKVVADTDSGSTSYAAQNAGQTSLVGGYYRTAMRAYIKSSNGSKVITLSGPHYVASYCSTTDAWTACTNTGVAIAAARPRLDIATTGKAIGDTIYLDAIHCLRQNSVSLLRGWVSPDFEATLAHISPASAVTPFGFICRYTDSLNYWEVRILPNTAGNDLQIVQVTAGVGTVRAEADIDWTAGETDYIKITAKAGTISADHMKHGESSYSTGTSYASATQGQTSAQLGVMFYATGVSRLGSLVLKRA